MAYPALVVAVHRNAVDLKYLDRDEETNVSVALVQAASQRVVARYRAVAATQLPAPEAAPATPRARPAAKTDAERPADTSGGGFAKGDKVVAPWSDGRRYAATVVSVGVTSTRVAFEDGSLHTVPSATLRSARFRLGEAPDDDVAAQPLPRVMAPQVRSATTRASEAAFEAAVVDELLAAVKSQNELDGGTLERYGFILNVKEKSRDRKTRGFTVSVPDDYPCFYDLVGREFPANPYTIRSIKQLILYLERALALAQSGGAYRTEAVGPKYTRRGSSKVSAPTPPPPCVPAPKKKRARVDAPVELCPICLEPLAASSPALSACGHRIHAHCLAGADGSLVSHAWADSKTRTRNGQKVLCPTCRAPSWVAPL